MAGNLTTFLIFLAISLVGLFLYRPKFEEVEKLAISIKTEFRDVKRNGLGHLIRALFLTQNPPKSFGI